MNMEKREVFTHGKRHIVLTPEQLDVKVAHNENGGAGVNGIPANISEQDTVEFEPVHLDATAEVAIQPEQEEAVLNFAQLDDIEKTYSRIAFLTNKTTKIPAVGMSAITRARSGHIDSEFAIEGNALDALGLLDDLADRDLEALTTWPKSENEFTRWNVEFNAEVGAYIARALKDQEVHWETAEKLLIVHDYIMVGLPLNGMITRENVQLIKATDKILNPDIGTPRLERYKTP